MRLAILDNGHGFGTKTLFAVIGALSRQPVPEILKVTRYRPNFFGTAIEKLVHKTMHGESAWSVADRELMAAFIARANGSEYCTRARTARASRACGDPAKVAAALSDLDAAPIAEPLRATLRMLGKLTRDGIVSTDDMRRLLAVGVSRTQIIDALAVSFAFNTIDRLADGLGFDIPGPAASKSGARFLLARGYR